ncbi:acetoacetate metabolism regulatory protein AtoC [Longispora fulva]|uniref:Transcriptional regulator with GAF, ATPase, and Fis domain n=1 Tax=Longispora fulva TaxID=619741 RepID=A0A8J7GE31_9ACTN|nr:sigma 54-interacting transcriptional regulator [Longispora fulva]MBG6134812.1 transcriptional regulator with GAF, ATPase, and Fis domain [Longispora fulva]GIG56956.1 acetoacetate metabolism regulatory protein AtoC [Longispora fulva]
MGDSQAWIRGLTPACESLADDVAAALRQTDVTVLPRAPDIDHVPRVLVCGADSGGLGAVVRDLSEGGRHRLLVVAGATTAISPGSTWRLLQQGASDVLVWDGQPTARVAAARLDRWRVIDELVDSAQVRDRLIGRSPCWRAVLRRVVEVARFSTSFVLVTGASGTGKELVANLIHQLDPRPDKRDLVVLDCTTVVPTLSGSEFFGHERGAFTGAVAPRDGAVALADGGTLFLDEVGELPASLQAELLRVVQEGAYKRVGSNVWRRTRFRLVCATNRDLVAEQQAGRFRSDLYYRISAATVWLPTLAQRPDDVLPLFRHFLREFRAGEPEPQITPEVAEVLRARQYPGNVRDLRQLALQVAFRHVGDGPITPGDLPEEERPVDGRAPADPGELLDEAVRRTVAAGLGLREIRDAAAESAIRAALTQTGGRVALAARLLGVTDRALQLRRSRAAGGT